MAGKNLNPVLHRIKANSTLNLYRHIILISLECLDHQCNSLSTYGLDPFVPTHSKFLSIDQPVLEENYKIHF